MKSIFKRMFNRFVFSHTKKPEHYVHIDTPKTLQEHRQVQYNNWCKRYGVYNGSYLPENPDVLKKKGWEETTSPKNNSADHRDFQRKSSKQMIRYDRKKYRKGRLEDEHYHWENCKSIKERRKLNKDNLYVDRYGHACEEDSPESHIAPKDRTYNYKK